MVRKFGGDVRDPALPFQPGQSGDRGRSPSTQPNTPAHFYSATVSPRISSIPAHPAPPSGFGPSASHHSQPYPVLPTRPAARPITDSDPTLPALNIATTVGNGAMTIVPQAVPVHRVQAQTLRSQIRPAQPSPKRLRPKVISVAAQATPLPPSTDQARWMPFFIWMHRGVGVATVAMVLTALGFYGQSVYYQQQWGQNYRQLQRLKTLEHQGIAANEMMKKTLLDQATAPGAGMQMPLPGTAIAIPKISPRQQNVVEQPPLRPNLALETPSGY